MTRKKKETNKEIYYEILEKNGKLKNEPKIMFDCFMNGEYCGTFHMYYVDAPNEVLRKHAEDTYPFLAEKDYLIVQQNSPLWWQLTYGIIKTK